MNRFLGLVSLWPMNTKNGMMMNRPTNLRRKMHTITGWRGEKSIESVREIVALQK